MRKYMTSEMVMPGHPDKLCDTIADAILDDYLTNDPLSRVAVEVSISYRTVFIMGEVTSKHISQVETIAKEVIKNAGYTKELGFDADGIRFIVDIHKQSSDIAQGVTKENNHLGAGDQGMMYGYATNETNTMLPLPYQLSILLGKKLQEVREKQILPYLRPDGKMQVTVLYEEDKPCYVDTIVLSTQHDENSTLEQLKKEIIEFVIKPVIPKEYWYENIKIFINPTGRFVVGGPVGDSGLTGRKIIVDTYGGIVPHGGGAFSGKDYTKVDRTATYYARYVAKNIVGANLASKCLIGVSYAIGMEEPISISVDTYHTGIMDDEKLLEIVKQVFDFRPIHMIEKLNMKKIHYQTLTNYGHFSHQEYPFEQLDMVDTLKSLNK